MNNQKGYINFPNWPFYFLPIGVLVVLIELIRLAMWMYEHIEVKL